MKKEEKIMKKEERKLIVSIFPLLSSLFFFAFLVPPGEFESPLPP